MRIVAKRTLREFWERHPSAEVPLRTWFARVKMADWSNPGEIKIAFGTTVDFVGDNRIIFDLGGNKFRLIARVTYSHRRVLIKFVGTHKDYDRIDAETV
jgi:mRNA interferase HigB